MKKLGIYLFVLALLCIFVNSSPVLANNIVKGTFESANYEFVEVDEDVTEKRLKDITISNSQGRTMTLPMDQFAKLTVDNRPTIIDAFKKGMEVEVHIDLRRVKEMHGKSTAHPATISYGDRVVTGTVSRLEPNRRSISLKLDNGQTENYTYSNSTRFFRENVNVSLAELYEGDRVKLTFVNHTTNNASAVEIMAEGVKIQALYKGKLHRIDRTNSKLIVNDVYRFMDWNWNQVWDWNYNNNPNTWEWRWPNSPSFSSGSFTYSKNTPIYRGNQRLSENQYDLYKDSDVYFVTVNKFGQSIVERIVIKDNYERTYHEPLNNINLRNKTFNLANLRNTGYHDGTIMIHNGRLVDENSLQNRNATAFVVTDGQQSSQYANIMYITNEGFQNPNLTKHELYYGRIDSISSNYNISLNNAVKLTNNSWSSVSSKNLSYSNDTNASVDDVISNNSNQLTLKNNLSTYIGRYGYFYVIDNKVVSLHVTSANSPQAQTISTGDFNDQDPNRNLSYTYWIQNVSRWNGSYWNDIHSIPNLDLRQAMIIRDGKTIQPRELKFDDQLYIIHDSTSVSSSNSSKVRFILAK